MKTAPSSPMILSAATGMAYVNQHNSSPIEPERKPNAFLRASRDIFRHFPLTNLRMWLAVGIAAILTTMVALLAISPSYAGLAALEFQPMLIVAPLRTYIFRNAVFNTGWLLLGIYPLALLLGWTWAVTGIPRWVRPLLLLPLFIPGALIGLLWRPLFSAWLDVAQAPFSLTVTGLVILWRAVPLAAWHFTLDRLAWFKLFPLCALLVLLDGDLILTLTHGEPFNATHTWASWILEQLWVSRAWGYAASMAGVLAVVIAMTVWLASRHTKSPVAIPYGSPLGLTVVLVWIIGPFAMPLLALLQAPHAALNTLINLSALFWLLNGALLWGGITLLAMRFTWRVESPRSRRLVWCITLAMLPIGTVALAYLSQLLPILRSQWLLIGLTGLLTAGLLAGHQEVPTRLRHQWLQAAGYASLVIAHSFPLQLVMQLPTLAWTPALGIVWTLAEAPQSTPALGAALLLYGMWAGMGAWLVA